MIEIITIGDELLCGRTIDTNAGMLCRELATTGHAVQRITSTGDAPEAIRAALLCCLPATRFVIVTGGLGPTEDDRTAAAAAQAFGDELILHPDALEVLRRELKRRHLPLNTSRQQQALLPSQCTLIANPVGTACGFVMRSKDRHYLFLPGVPAEALAMARQFVTGFISREAGQAQPVLCTTMRVFGLREAEIQEKLTGILDSASDVNLGFYPQFPEVLLQLTARGPDAATVKKNLNRVRDTIAQRIGSCTYAGGDVSLMEVVGRLLADGGNRVAVAESCTGGLLAHLITSVPGSSAWFNHGLVVYSNASKIQRAGVDESILAQHGAVSSQTAQALAQGVRCRAADTYGIGITGIAGPGGGTPEKPVGTVFFAIAGPENCRTYHRLFTGSREQIALLSAYTALDLLRRTLLGLNIDFVGQTPV